jgi:hypothetical protein
MRPDVERDRTALAKVQRVLACGMTVASVESVIGQRIKRMEPPVDDRTHEYSLKFATLWLVFRDERLSSSQISVMDGLATMKQEERIDHCGKRN